MRGHEPCFDVTCTFVYLDTKRHHVGMACTRLATGSPRMTSVMQKRLMSALLFLRLGAFYKNHTP